MPREELDPARRRRGARVDLDAVRGRTTTPSGRPVPAKSPRQPSAAPVTIERAPALAPWSEPTYCTPTSAASGRPSFRHSLPRTSSRALPSHLPVHVVRGEEREVAAEVAEARDHVVLVTRHVLLVAGEDDEVVAPRELVAARDRVEVVVGDEVDLLPGPVAAMR